MECTETNQSTESPCLLGESHEWTVTPCGNRCIKCGLCMDEKQGYRCQYIKIEGRVSYAKASICEKSHKALMETIKSPQEIHQ
jgi:hypothetical protein